MNWLNKKINRRLLSNAFNVNSFNTTIICNILTFNRLNVDAFYMIYLILWFCALKRIHQQTLRGDIRQAAAFRFNNASFVIDHRKWSFCLCLLQLFNYYSVQNILATGHPPGLSEVHWFRGSDSRDWTRKYLFFCHSIT